MALELTKSENEVVRLKCLGFSEKQIACQRFVSLHTVKTLAKRALRKNNLKNGFELVARYAANHPNLFKNMLVVLFLSIQGFIISIDADIDLRRSTRSRVKTVKVRRSKIS